MLLHLHIKLITIHVVIGTNLRSEPSEDRTLDLLNNEHHKYFLMVLYLVFINVGLSCQNLS